MISENTISLLDFDKVLAEIALSANSDISRDTVLAVRPLSDMIEIRKRLDLIEELRCLFHKGDPLRMRAFTDISLLIKKVRTEGSVLEGFELACFVPVLEMMNEILQQIALHDDIVLLKEIAGGIIGQPVIAELFRKCLDSAGNILDSASVVLAGIRKDIRKRELGINRKLEEIMRDSSVSIFLQDDFATKRGGRWVIPVRMDSKGQVHGVVHDVSKSGETAFIEPLEILNLSNELENLIAEEKAEEIRILRKLSSHIRQNADEIQEEFRIIVYLDVLQCIAQFADSMRMQRPDMNNEGIIDLVDARHPLLLLAQRKGRLNTPVVPLDVRLGDDNHVMVITGSNAGGKTIAIKTVGLLMVMVLSGFPVPADSSSRFPFVRKLLVDIGDEQSIENSLSTFSAHISHISKILRLADRQSLILIDELGTGTDPDEGTALSCAVLKKFLDAGSLVFITTHLSGIKSFAHLTRGMVNASMNFDRQTLTPLYRLRIGEPGQSHALDVARNYGLPEDVLAAAKELMGEIKIEFDNLIADLNEKRTFYERSLDETAARLNEAEAIKKTYEQKITEAGERQKKILSAAYQEALNIVSDAKRQMHDYLHELKARNRAAVRKEIKKVEGIQELINEKSREYRAPAEDTIRIDDMHKGDIIYVKSLGYDAEIVAIIPRHERVRVKTERMEIDVPASDIAARRGKSLESRMKKDGSFREISSEAVASRINLVGMRVDEALSQLEPFLNRALLSGLSEVVVIHGIGKGLLSRAVDEHLTAHPLVKEFRKGNQSEGGGGVTVVTLLQ